jgi:hypothetical protein
VKVEECRDCGAWGCDGDCVARKPRVERQPLPRFDKGERQAREPRKDA